MSVRPFLCNNSETTEQIYLYEISYRKLLLKVVCTLQFWLELDMLSLVYLKHSNNARSNLSEQKIFQTKVVD
jgi:hypothetical protein